MSAITRMLEQMEITHPVAKMTRPAKTIHEWIKAYAEKESAEYANNKDKGLISFGKYKGQSVEAVMGLDKGAEYLLWVQKQSWFTEDKFSVLYPKIVEALKKTKSRAEL